MAGGKSSRQKGDRFERELVNRFLAEGISARRIPMSGASPFEGFSGYDLVIEMFSKPRNVECKHYGKGFKMLYDWLSRDENDLLIIRADRSEALAVIPLPILIEMIKTAKGKK